MILIIDPMGKKDLVDLVYKWDKAFVEQDIELLEKILSADQCIILGTSENEFAYDKETMLRAIEKLFSDRQDRGSGPKKHDKFKFDLETNIISHYGANGLGYVFVEFPKSSFGFTRATYVMNKQNNNWKLIHVHLSVPDPLFKAGEDFRSQERMKRELEKWIKDYEFNPLISENLKLTKFKSYLTEASNLLNELSE